MKSFRRNISAASTRTDSPGDTRSSEADVPASEELKISEPALKYEPNELKVGDSCPWGTIEWVHTHAPGIDEVATDGNEAFFVSPERQESIDPLWRSKDGWYDRASRPIPIIAHHKEFNLEMIYRAHKSAANRYPEEYEAVVVKHPAECGLDRIMAALGK